MSTRIITVLDWLDAHPLAGTVAALAPVATVYAIGILLVLS